MLLTGLEIRRISRGKIGWFCIRMMKQKLGSMLNRLDSSCEKTLMCHVNKTRMPKKLQAYKTTLIWNTPLTTHFARSFFNENVVFQCF